MHKHQSGYRDLPWRERRMCGFAEGGAETGAHEALEQALRNAVELGTESGKRTEALQTLLEQLNAASPEDLTKRLETLRVQNQQALIQESLQLLAQFDPSHPETIVPRVTTAECLLHLSAMRRMLILIIALLLTLEEEEENVTVTTPVETPSTDALIGMAAGAIATAVPKTETPAAEPKVEPKTEPPRVEPPRVEPPRVDPPRMDPPRPPDRVDPPRPETLESILAELLKGPLRQEMAQAMGLTGDVGIRKVEPLAGNVRVNYGVADEDTESFEVPVPTGAGPAKVREALVTAATAERQKRLVWVQDAMKKLPDNIPTLRGMVESADAYQAKIRISYAHPDRGVPVTVRLGKNAADVEKEVLRNGYEYAVLHAITPDFIAKIKADYGVTIRFGRGNVIHLNLDKQDRSIEANFKKGILGVRDSVEDAAKELTRALLDDVIKKTFQDVEAKAKTKPGVFGVEQGEKTDYFLFKSTKIARTLQVPQNVRTEKELRYWFYQEAANAVANAPAGTSADVKQFLKDLGLDGELSKIEAPKPLPK